MARLRSKEAEQIIRDKLKDYLEHNVDAVKAIRGRDVFNFGADGNTWIGGISVFPKEVLKKASLRDGWIDRPEDRARVWIQVIVAENGTATVEEVADWRTL